MDALVIKAGLEPVQAQQGFAACERVGQNARTDAMAKDNAVRQKWSLFAAEAAYAHSIFRSAIGDSAGCIQALERAIEIKPTYAPAVLAMGSVDTSASARLREESFCFLS
jgi:hypothetical protein